MKRTESDNNSHHQNKMASASSSAHFFSIQEEEQQLQPPPLQSQQQSSSSAPPPPPNDQATAPVKKKRTPGTPYPDAEVIALSPKTLLATNRFICEVCNKGFQREQNLQLHRRGHNLPWKLKQKNPKEVRRRVYLCPEPTCVHHDPSRALGDLTGIKKHFCRKHGEKKWKCEKCSKRYAVQSDWKAHSKTCGTREYRCDCGTLFSRRDSFITHRAFCDALAQENVRLPSGLTAFGGHLYGNNNMALQGLSQVNSQLTSSQDQNHPSAGLLHLGGTGVPQFDQVLSPSSSSSFRSPHPQSSSAYYLGRGGMNQEFGEESQPPPHHSSLLQNNIFNLNFFSGGNMTANAISNNNNNNSGSNQNHHHLLVNADQFGSGNGSMDHSTLFSGNLMSDQMGVYNSSLANESVLPQMSATALLQKAAQMGATTSAAGNFRPSGFGGEGDGFRAQMENDATAHIHDLMNSLANGSSGLFGGHEQVNNGGLAGAFGASLCNMNEAKFSLPSAAAAGNAGGGSDGLTRDFLGVGSMVRSMGQGGISPRDQRQHDIGAMSSFETEMKSASSSRSFGGGGMQ